MANEVRIRTSVSDQASKPIKDLHDAFDRLKSPAGAAGVAMGLTASLTTKAFDLAGESVSKTVDFMVDAVKAAEDEQTSTARMTTALKANVAGWDGSTDAIDKRIQAGIRLGYSDDDIRDSFTRLVGTTHDVNKAFDAQKVAMDLSRLKGVSLSDATEAIVRAQAHQYRALKDLGIELPKTATAEQALAAVERVAAGQSEAYANTIAGKTDQLSARFEQLKETVGGKVIPVLNDAVGGLADLGDAMDNGADSSVKLTTGAAKLEAVLSGFVTGPSSATHLYFQNIADSVDATERAAIGAQGALDSARAVWDEYKQAANEARLGNVAVEGSLKTLSSTLDHSNAIVYTGTERLIDWGNELDRAAKKAGDDQFSVQELGDQFQIASDRVETDIAALEKLQALKNPTQAQRDDLAKTDLQVITDKRDVIDLGAKMLAAGKISFADLIRQYQSLGIQLYKADGTANDLLKTLRLLSGQSGAQQTGVTGVRGRRAAGGPVSGGDYVVGENGPELLHLSGSQAGYVSPSASQGSGLGSAPTLVFQFPNAIAVTPGAAQAIADAVAPVITRWQQRNGILPRSGSPMLG